jgi:hypothetical protein
MVLEASVHSCLLHALGRNITAVGAGGKEVLYLMVARKQSTTKGLGTSAYSRIYFIPLGSTS